MECHCTSEAVILKPSVQDPLIHKHRCNLQLQLENNSACSPDTYIGGCENNEFCLERDEIENTIASDAVYYRRYSIDYSVVVPANRPMYLAACCDASGDFHFSGNIEHMYPNVTREVMS